MRFDGTDKRACQAVEDTECASRTVILPLFPRSCDIFPNRGSRAPTAAEPGGYLIVFSGKVRGGVGWL